MAPDIGKYIEVGGVIFGAVGVVPEIDRHGGEGRGAYQFALLPYNRPAVFIERFHLHGQSAALKLSGIDRSHWIAQSEASVQVGSAGYAGQLQIRFDVPIDKVEPFHGERRSG
jgi:hypothetical protein